MNTTEIGRWGETEVARYLEKQGYTIVEKNYRTRFGEIDLIAQKGKIVAFVEVKLRSSSDFARGIEAVDRTKIQKILVTAGNWIIQHEDCQPRFDVAEVCPDPAHGLTPGTAKINYLAAAFSECLGHDH